MICCSTAKKILGLINENMTWAQICQCLGIRDSCKKEHQQEHVFWNDSILLGLIDRSNWQPRLKILDALNEHLQK